MTIGLIIAAAVVAVVGMVVGGTVIVNLGREPKGLWIDQTDPLMLEAVREVDAFLPAMPILDPAIAEREAREARQAANQAAVERAFFERKHRVPLWNRPDADCYTAEGMIRMKDGRQVSPEAVALYGWDAVLSEALTKLGGES